MALSALSVVVALASEPCAVSYTATAAVDSKPVLSYLDGTSVFGQVFNPSWIEASPFDSSIKPGLLVRTQNCSVGYGATGCGLYDPHNKTHGCCAWSDDEKVTAPSFEHLTAESIVFEPVNQPPVNPDLRGTEDPRVALDKSTGIYYMFYTCYSATAASLCLASTKNPTVSTGWTRHGPAFPGDHKSGALLIRDSPPHYLISGAGEIHMSQSDDLLKWTLGPVFINSTAWGNPNVEAGPPPLKLSDGNYVFFHNSWGGKGVPQPGYQPSWVILDGTDPTKILARAPAPLWSPNDYSWMAGNTQPGTQCNVPQVSFLEAAHETDEPDTFRVYYGGSDAVLGTATVSIKKSAQHC